MEIIPGILEKEWSEIEKKIEVVLPFAKTIHIDLLDGTFAPNTTLMDPVPFKKYADQVLLELHMMVENPIQYVKPFADVGFKRFLGHVEKMPDIPKFIAEARTLGEACLAIDGKTSVGSFQVNYENLDGMVIMTINAGFSGQEFNKDYLEKVRTLRQNSAKNSQGEPFPIEVDGGINDQTILLAKKAGATRFVANSFLFNGNSHKQFKKLEQILVVD